MKTNLEELLETARQLSERLSQAAEDEMIFSQMMQEEFEKMSWEMLRMSNELEELKSYI